MSGNEKPAPKAPKQILTIVWHSASQPTVVIPEEFKPMIKKYVVPMCAAPVKALLEESSLRPDDCLRLLQMAHDSCSAFPDLQVAKRTCGGLLMIMQQFAAPLSESWWECLLPRYHGTIKAKIIKSNDTTFFLDNSGAWAADVNIFFPRFHKGHILIQVGECSGNVTAEELSRPDLILFDSPIPDLINEAIIQRLAAHNQLSTRPDLRGRNIFS